MSDFREGDLVEATKGQDLIRGHVQIGCDGGEWVGATKWTLKNLAVHAWEVSLIERAPEPLPTEPGTVIAIGDWWLVRLRPYETTTHSAWELLPMRTKFATENAERNGVKTQCVYSDDWVRSEVEQEGGFTIISKPVAS